MEDILKRIDEARDIVDLRWRNISNEILKEISGKLMGKEGLKELHLGGNQIGDMSPLAEGLRYNTSLKRLYLSCNHIRDVSPLVEVLRYNSSLEGLWLNGNHIREVYPLGEGLRHNSSLTALYLDSNRITDLSPIAEGLRYNYSLKAMWNTDNPIRDRDALIAIEDMLETNNLNNPNRKATLFEMMMNVLSPLE